MAKRTIEESKAEDVDIDMEDETVDVDFDFFNIVESDFLSIKHLLRQLFDVDNTKFNLTDLAQAIIESGVGTSIKTEGEESDPFALISIVDAKKLADSGLSQYWIERTGQADTPELNRTLRKLFSDKSSDKVGIVFSERLLNMPLEVVHPLYSLLVQELTEQDVHYDYLIIPSKAYTEHESQLDDAPEQPTKKGTAGPETFYFHLEDELLHETAVAFGNFPLSNKIHETDSRRAFSEYGILPQGHLSVLKTDKLEATLKVLEKLNGSEE